MKHACFSQGGESLSVQRQQLEELYLAHSGSMSILLEEDDGLQNHNHGLPQGPANFTLLWYSLLFKAAVVGSWFDAGLGDMDRIKYHSIFDRIP